MAGCSSGGKGKPTPKKGMQVKGKATAKRNKKSKSLAEHTRSLKATVKF